VLQCVAVSKLQCEKLLFVRRRCNTLQHTATTLQCLNAIQVNVMQCIGVCCSTLQSYRVAKSCSALQCVEYFLYMCIYIEMNVYVHIMYVYMCAYTHVYIHTYIYV